MELSILPPFRFIFYGHVVFFRLPVLWLTVFCEMKRNKMKCSFRFVKYSKPVLFIPGNNVTLSIRGTDYVYLLNILNSII